MRDISHHRSQIFARFVLTLLLHFPFAHSKRLIEMASASLFIGTYTENMAHVKNASGQGIYVFDLSSSSDNGSVVLKQSYVINNVINPSFLDITHNKTYLYAVTESLSNEKSLIHGYEIRTGTTGKDKYRYIDSWPIGGIGACHVSIDKDDRFVIVSNYNGGNVAAFKIDLETGRLAKRNFLQFTEFSNVNKERQEAPHLHSSIIDQQLRYVYFADLGNDCIWRFNYSMEKGFDIDTKRKFAAPPGSGPRHMAFDPINYRFLYVTCELTNHILAYKVEEDGSLEQIQYEATTPRVASYKGPGGTADIHVSPDGRFVYVTTRFLNVISVFEVQNDGKLKFAQEISSGGDIPRNFALYQPLNLVLVGNQDSNDITVFKRDETSGRLTQIQQAKVNTPVVLNVLD